MYLPESVRLCLDTLARSGFRGYAVGGCVRDALLGLRPHDYDLCTDARPEQLCRIFSDYTLVRSGEKHGTVGVVVDGQVIEITTFRTEGGYHDSRHPDWVEFVDDIKADLSRRDFTVNAMAYCPAEGYIDPWGGHLDLKNRVLRAVGTPATRFTEDALRILRGVRFAVRFRLNPEDTTLNAMFSLAPLMDNLARERVFDELCKLLPLVTAADLKQFAPILTQVIPELLESVDFDQHSPHHAYDVFTHTAYVVESTPPELALRWSALLHDVGKPASFTQDETGRGHFKGHAKISAQAADDILIRLKAPAVLRQRVVFLVENHMLPLEPDKRVLRRRLGKYGVEALIQLLTLQEADFGSKGTEKPEEGTAFSQIRTLVDEILAEDACLSVKDLAVNGSDLLAVGFAPGPRLGDCLAHLLEQVQNEDIPNEKNALLQAAKTYLEQ